MDVPLALNDIGILNGLKGNRKSSTISQQADVVGLSAFTKVLFLKKVLFMWLLHLSFYHKVKNKKNIYYANIINT